MWLGAYNYNIHMNGCSSVQTKGDINEGKDSIR